MDQIQTLLPYVEKLGNLNGSQVNNKMVYVECSIVEEVKKKRKR
jgi:hypothetical protein